jgi:hypothetical protein
VRTDGFSFQHYVVLARLPEAEQKEWVGIARAYGGRVPTRQLAKSIELSDAAGSRKIWPKEEIAEATMREKSVFIDAPEPVLDRFVRSMQRQDFSQWTPQMKRNLWRRWEVARKIMEGLGL